MRFPEIILCIIFALVSCDDKFEIPNYYSGTVTANLNNKNWSALIHGVNYDQDSFHIQVANFDSEKIKREVLDLVNIPKESGVYTLTSNFVDLSAIYMTLAADGDVGCDTYYLVDNGEYENTLTITKFENGGQNIEGTFKLTFYHIRPDDKCDNNAPDTIKFRNGVFQTKITR